MVISDFPSAIVYILVGIAILLIGMKMMSAGLRKCIGHSIRRFFKKTEKKPIVSFGIGTIVTAGIQSSDATNAMVIGFINAGAMSLFQGLCIMLGAYVGTTVTGILASFSSLPISLYFLLLTFIGSILTFFKSDLLKNIGNILAGLGLLFVGLAIMKSGFKQDDIVNGLKQLFCCIDFSVLLYLIGIVFAAVMQSSSAVTSIVIALVGSASLSLGSGLYIVLGAMVGTLLNTILVSLNGSVNGKRASYIALALRIITTLIGLLFVSIFNDKISEFFHIFAVNNSDELPLALFTLFFNLIFMPLCIPLLKPMICLFEKVIKDKEQDKLKSAIRFINKNMLNTPSIAEMQVKNEILNMYDLSFENYQNGINRILSDDSSKDNDIEEIESKLDYLNGQITDFLIELSSKVDKRDEKRVGAFFHVINDIERIGDHAYNFFEMCKDMKNKDLSFTNNALDELAQFNSTILKMFELAKIIFRDKDFTKLTELNDLESITDELKVKFSTNHYNRIKSKECIYELSPYYSNILVELERVADHLNNIGYSIVNPVGDEK